MGTTSKQTFPYFYIDSRSLALFRILISLVVLHDLGVRLSDFAAHYTDLGVLPLDALNQHFLIPGQWSLATISHNSIYTLLLFAAGLFAAIMMLLGRQVRLMTIITWIVLMSVQNRNPVLYQGGDDMLRMVIFWFIFVPQIPKHEKGQVLQITGWATMALLLQALFPLQFSGFYKGTYEWWYQGSALNFALQLDQVARPLGLWLRDFPAITTLLTRIVYIAELLVLPIFLFPYFRERVRSITFIVLVLFSTGIMSLMMIGLFPLCILACSALFIPTSLWQKFKPAKTITPYTTRNKPAIAWGKMFGMLFLFVITCWWNIADVRGSILRFPQSFRKPVYMLGLNQTWGMFAPTVFKEDGWLILEATLNNGNKIDLNNNELAIDFSKPHYVLDRIKNDRWRKYTEQISLLHNKDIRQHYANYIVWQYNKKQRLPEEQLASLDIYYMLEYTKLKTPMIIEQKLLYHWEQ